MRTSMSTNTQAYVLAHDAIGEYAPIRADRISGSAWEFRSGGDDQGGSLWHAGRPAMTSAVIRLRFRMLGPQSSACTVRRPSRIIP